MRRNCKFTSLFTLPFLFFLLFCDHKTITKIELSQKGGKEQLKIDELKKLKKPQNDEKIGNKPKYIYEEKIDSCKKSVEIEVGSVKEIKGDLRGKELLSIFIAPLRFETPEYRKDPKDVFYGLPNYNLLYFLIIDINNPREIKASIKTGEGGLIRTLWGEYEYNELYSAEILCNSEDKVCLKRWTEKNIPIKRKEVIEDNYYYYTYVQIIKGKDSLPITQLSPINGSKVVECSGVGEEFFYYTVISEAQVYTYRINHLGIPEERKVRVLPLSEISYCEYLNSKGGNSLILLIKGSNGQALLDILQDKTTTFNTNSFSISTTKNEYYILSSEEEGTILVEKISTSDFSSLINSITRAQNSPLPKESYKLLSKLRAKSLIFNSTQSNLFIAINGEDNKSEVLILNEGGEKLLWRTELPLRIESLLVQEDNSFWIIGKENDMEGVIKQYQCGTEQSEPLSLDLSNLLETSREKYIEVILRKAQEERKNGNNVRAAWLWEIAYYINPKEPRYLLKGAEDLISSNYPISSFSRIKYLGNIKDEEIKRAFLEYCDSDYLKKFRYRTDFQQITGCIPTPKK